MEQKERKGIFLPEQEDTVINEAIQLANNKIKKLWLRAIIKPVGKLVFKALDNMVLNRLPVKFKNALISVVDEVLPVV